MDWPECSYTPKPSAAASPGLDKKRKCPNLSMSTKERESVHNSNSERSRLLSTAFSAGTRRKVEAISNNYCWFCGAVPVDIDHVVGCKDDGVSRPSPLTHTLLNCCDLVFSSQALTNRLARFQEISHANNAIALRPTCHSNFGNLNQPSIIFIPTNLQYFIDSERNGKMCRQVFLHTTGRG
jgi:hypothetical protein